MAWSLSRSLPLVVILACASVVGCKKSDSAPEMGVSGGDKGKVHTKLGKVLGDVTKEDLAAALTKAGFTPGGSSASKSPGSVTYSASGKKGDVSVFVTVAMFSDAKARTSIIESKKKDVNRAVFADGDCWAEVEAKEKDHGSPAKSKELMATLIGP